MSTNNRSRAARGRRRRQVHQGLVVASSVPTLPPPVRALDSCPKPSSAVESFVRLRYDPFASVGKIPCNIRGQAIPTIRAKSLYRFTMNAGTNGVGYVAINTSAFASDAAFIAYTDGSYALAGVDSQFGTPGVNTLLNTQNPFNALAIAGPGTTASIGQRKIAYGIRVSPAGAATDTPGVGYSYLTTGGHAAATLFTPAAAGADKNTVVAALNKRECMVARWEPHDADDEDFIYTTGQSVNVNWDLAVIVSGATPRYQYLVEVVAYSEYYSRSELASMAVPSEQNLAASGAAQTVVSRHHTDGKIYDIGSQPRGTASFMEEFRAELGRGFKDFVIQHAAAAAYNGARAVVGSALSGNARLRN